MLFAEKIKQLRDFRQMPQRQIAAALEIDTATYCKIEKGDRRAKREQVDTIAELLNADKDELLSLWLAEQVIDIIKDDKRIIDSILKIVKQEIAK